MAGNETISDHPDQNWFQYFKGGDLLLESLADDQLLLILMVYKVEENSTTGM